MFFWKLWKIVQKKFTFFYIWLEPPIFRKCIEIFKSRPFFGIFDSCFWKVKQRPNGINITLFSFFEVFTKASQALAKTKNKYFVSTKSLRREDLSYLLHWPRCPSWHPGCRPCWGRSSAPRSPTAPASLARRWRRSRSRPPACQCPKIKYRYCILSGKQTSIFHSYIILYIYVYKIV